MKPYIILALLIALAFANSFQNSFVWDDYPLIVNNPKIDLSIREIPSAFAAPFWKVPDFSGERQVYYRPVISMLYVLNYKIWGLNPKGFHLVNVLLHLINAILLCRIGLLFLNSEKLTALIAASIFAVHPIHNESVGRPASGEVLFGFFIIMSIYLFLRERNYLSYLTFSFALFSKEGAVMLPFALIILAVHKRGFKNGLIIITPYMSIVVIYLILRAIVVDTVFGNGVEEPLFEQKLTMAVAAFDYIKLLLIPYPLSPFYPARWYTSVFEPKVLPAIAVLILVFFIAFKIRKDKAMLFLFVSPFIMLFPVVWKVNTFIAGWDLMYIAERFLYVPSMLFFIFVSASLAKLFKNRLRGCLTIGWILVLIIFTVTTASSNMMWKDNITLFQRIIKESPDIGFAHSNLGDVYASQGRFDKAAEEYTTALRISPHHSKAYDSLANVHNNLGNVYYDRGRLDDAIKEYLTALGFKPDHANAHYNLGDVYYDSGRLDDAIKEYLIVLKLKPDDAETHYNLGRVYYKKGLKQDAETEFETALKLKPDFAAAKTAIGLLESSSR